MWQEKSIKKKQLLINFFNNINECAWVHRDRTLYNWKRRNAISPARKFPYQRDCVYIGYAIRSYAYYYYSSFEFNHRTSINHANTFFLYDYNRVVVNHNWTWPSVDKHKLYVCECIRSLKKSRWMLDIYGRSVIYWEC
jgi:hypothetical protein